MTCFSIIMRLYELISSCQVSADIGWFSEFFYWHTLNTFAIKWLLKELNKPQMRRYIIVSFWTYKVV